MSTLFGCESVVMYVMLCIALLLWAWNVVHYTDTIIILVIHSHIISEWFLITLCELFTWPAIIATHPDPSWKRSCYVAFVNARVSSHAAFDIINRLTIMPDRRGSFILNSKLLLSSLYPT